MTDDARAEESRCPGERIVHFGGASCSGTSVSGGLNHAEPVLERRGATMIRSTGLRTFELAAGLALLVVIGCGGGDRRQTDTSSGAAAIPVPPAAETGAAPGGMTPPMPGPPPEGATAAMVAMGDSIFRGQVAGGTCFTCHGVDARGTPLAPPLIKHEWRTGDGSYAFIQKRVTEGVPSPTAPYGSPMLPMGGAQLTPDQVKAVAAYVYAISHP